MLLVSRVHDGVEEIFLPMRAAAVLRGACPFTTNTSRIVNAFLPGQDLFE
jgi:hypothetical protein